MSYQKTITACFVGLEWFMKVSSVLCIFACRFLICISLKRVV